MCECFLPPWRVLDGMEALVQGMLRHGLEEKALCCPVGVGCCPVVSAGYCPVVVGCCPVGDGCCPVKVECCPVMAGCPPPTPEASKQVS